MTSPLCYKTGKALMRRPDCHELYILHKQTASAREVWQAAAVTKGFKATSAASLLHVIN